MNERFWRLLRAFALLPLCTGAALAQPLPSGAAACAEALAEAERSAEAGDELLYFAGDYCPEFLAALEASPWAANLPLDQAFYLGNAGLTTLLETASRYDPATETALSLERLDGLVAELEPFVPEPAPSIWDRFWDWLGTWFQSDEGEETWLGKWLNAISVPESWRVPILLTIAGIVVVTVLAILINELRLGGVFLGRTARALRAAAASRVERTPAIPTFDAIRTTPAMGRKVEMLFALVVDRMRRRYRGLLPPALTHRELAQVSGELDSGARESLSRVAGAAERVTYANWEPDGESFQAILASGESLVRQLEHEPGDGA